MKRIATIILGLVLVSAVGAGNMVMGQNTDELPPRCGEITGWENITVHGGTQYADQFPGTVFTYDDRIYEFDPCTKVTVTFVNHDDVRHQWMVHGLPPATYDMSMFNIEVDGPGNETGTFILPGRDETLLTHCGVPQHEEKGMKGQIVVGAGDGRLGGIPGETGRQDGDNYPRRSPWREGGFFALVGILIGGAVMIGWQHGDVDLPSLERTGDDQDDESEESS